MRYFLDTDDDGHWYLIPAVIRGEWEDVGRNNAYEDFDFGSRGVISLGCHPNNVSFDEPALFDEPIGVW